MAKLSEHEKETSINFTEDGRHGKKRNIAVAAIARELACFVWGMMTENIEGKAA